MPTTTKLALPYPAAADPADVPLDMQELADRIDLVTGSANGLAALGADGKIPATQLATQEIVYGQITGTLNVNPTTAGTAIPVASTGSITYDGATTVLLEFFAPYCNVGSGGNLALLLYDGATQGPDVASLLFTGIIITIRRRLTPTAGAHDYSIRAYRTATSASIVAGTGIAGDFIPGFIRVTRA